MSVEEMRSSEQIDDPVFQCSLEQSLDRRRRFNVVTNGEYKDRPSILNHVVKRLDTLADEPSDEDFIYLVNEAIVSEKIIDEFESRRELPTDAEYQQLLHEAMLHLHDANS